MSPSDQETGGAPTTQEVPPEPAATSAEPAAASTEPADTGSPESAAKPPTDESDATALSDIGAETSSTGENDARVSATSNSMQMLMDVDLNVTAELGRTRMSIGEIMNLSAGSIIALGKVAGETIDLRVNDKLLASGEVIVVDGNFAIKITKLLSKEERVKNFS